MPSLALMSSLVCALAARAGRPTHVLQAVQRRGDDFSPELVAWDRVGASQYPDMREPSKPSGLPLPEAQCVDQGSLFDANNDPRVVNEGPAFSAPRVDGRDSRNRITVDLRGVGARLHASAASRGTTASALVRKAVLELLDGATDMSEARCVAVDRSLGCEGVKVTLRLSEAHARALARRACAADVSRGAYVEGLIDGAPPQPLPRDHADAVTALTASTDQLAVIGVDLNALMRLLPRGKSSELEQYRARVMSLVDDVRGHLALAALLLTELRMARRPRDPARVAPRGQRRRP